MIAIQEQIFNKELVKQINSHVNLPIFPKYNLSFFFKILWMVL